MNDIISQQDADTVDIPPVLPLLPVREIVVFPYMVLPLYIGRPMSIAAVEAALTGDRLILVATQKALEDEHPTPDNIHGVGTVCSIMRMLQLPDNRIKILIQGVGKVRIDEYRRRDPYFEVVVDLLAEAAEPPVSVEAEALVRTVIERVEQIVGFGRTLAPDVLALLEKTREPGRLADMIVANLGMGVEASQETLETLDPVVRLGRVAELLDTELSVLTVQQQIQSDARGEMERSQREYVLREQMKSIRRELGDEDGRDADIRELRDAITAAKMPEKVAEEADKQLARLERMHPDSSESAMTRTYLDWLVELPWSVTTEDRLDLNAAHAVLEEDHYGLHDVKERILEYLAVCQLKGAVNGPILCLLGPPGVGKTSLGRSIARALGRQFIRLALGGVRDEAEVRGHRRTYVGAMPGRIIQAMKQAGSCNPLIMLDEVDKLGADFRGDPASALLEVLDPEQNHTFTDHYLGVPFDLSRAMFVTTCNRLDTIPGPLQDRMEVISLSSYTVAEKTQIARRYLVPKQVEAHGLGGDALALSDSVVNCMVTRYTREAGVRGLEREIAKVCRKVARRVAEGHTGRVVVRPAGLGRYLGVPPFEALSATLQTGEPGTATGLAWTPVGGDFIQIETTLVDGKGILILTGQLGDVMKESAQTAYTCVRSRCDALGVKPQRFSAHDVHIHVPAGAIPKDGPSAGITMAVAIASAFSGAPILPDLAMTGEVTLRGHVLAVGGIKEKMIAAHAAGLRRVILPRANEKDIPSVPAPVRKALQFHLVERLDEVFALALGPVPATADGVVTKDLMPTDGHAKPRQPEASLH